MEHSVLLYGGGGHAKVVTDALKRADVKIVHIFDDRAGVDITDKDGRTISKYRMDHHSHVKLIVTIGDNATRKRIAQTVNHKFEIVTDPSVTMASSASVQEGSMVLHGAIIQAFTNVGKHVIINTAASIDHDCHIGDYAHIGPRSVLCGKVTVGEGTLIGAGSCIAPGVRIGKWSIIGTGSVVIKDIPDYCVAVGNPARVIKQLAH